MMKACAATLRRLQPLPGVMLAFALAVAGYAIRYAYIEPEALGIACEKGLPWWCLPRTALIIFTQWNGFGQGAMLCAMAALALWALGRDHLLMAMLAMAAGGAGLLLYNATLSSVAVVGGALLLSYCRRQAP